MRVGRGVVLAVRASSRVLGGGKGGQQPPTVGVCARALMTPRCSVRLASEHNPNTTTTTMSGEQANLLLKSERELSAVERQQVEEFKAFLRIRSISNEGPLTGAYEAAVAFLEDVCRRCGLPTERVELVANKPILLAKWEGTAPELPSILLNSHYDVVPVENDKWDHDPFAAHEDEGGNIFARGTQDMKCVCMMYLHAIEQLKKRGVTPQRTVHLSFMPDEELGGMDGMNLFVDSDRFKQLNVAMAMDEGLASPSDPFVLFHGERAVWWVKVKAEGNTGHASRFVQNTAMEKLAKFLAAVQTFRDEQEKKLGGHGCAHAVAKKLGDVVTVNVTMLDAGSFVVGPDGEKRYALNVVPSVCRAGFDMRVPPNVPVEEMRNKINEWTAADGVSWEPVTPQPEHAVTRLDCVWFEVLQKTLGAMNKSVQAEIFPAATDSRFLRLRNVPCFGFSPINRTPVLLHDHNEMLNREVYVDGVVVYEQLIPALASVPAE